MARLALFVGKGGVGKTTVSAAYAVHQALRHPRETVLLLSTDPAHSVSDIFQQPFSKKIMPARLPKGKLQVWQVDAAKQFRTFLDKRRADILAILESGSIFSKEEIEPFLDATLPGMAEMSALLAIDDALESGHYEQVVVDTAPFGHTLRLFELPEHFRKFLAFLELAASRDQVLAAHFGGSGRVVGQQLLADWKRTVETLLVAFREQAEIFLVTTPERFALNESIRCSEVLGKLSPPLEISSVILNRAVVGTGACRTCRKRQQATRNARALLKQHFASSKMYVAQDSGNPVAGVEGLRIFGAHVFSGGRLRWNPAAPKSAAVKLLRTEWPALETPVSMVLGKGGVGKTTISAALGFRTRSQRQLAVEICSVDPAPSLDDVFQTEVGDEASEVLGDPRFRASEMDSVAAFQSWAARITHLIDSSLTSDRTKIHVDLWFERQLFEQLLQSVPPGVDEILAIFRILDLLGDKAKRVVIDMAPTGHAIDLLRTPERILSWTRLLLKTLAAHRKLAVVQDAGVEVAELGHRIRDLVKLLGNSESVRIYTVMLAEALPDRETERLVGDLRSLKLPPGPLFVNRLLFPQDVGKCARCRRARAWQNVTLAKLRKRFPGMKVFVARNFPGEIAGKKGLRSFTGQLWRLA
ncbi:MAG TPA: ArsA family ATPase [Terriglobales bacterium]|nr:ArsA family ATPase [Terriglobales bacterium]